MELGLDSMSSMSLHSTLCDSSGGKQKNVWEKKGMRDRVFFLSLLLLLLVVVVVVVVGGEGFRRIVVFPLEFLR